MKPNLSIIFLIMFKVIITFYYVYIVPNVPPPPAPHNKKTIFYFLDFLLVPVSEHVNKLKGLEGTARYAGLLLAPAKGFGQGFFWPKGLFTQFVLILRHFFCSVVTSITFSSNHSNFENNAKKKQTIKISKIKKKKVQKCIFLVLPIDNIILLPEFSSPPRFRIQWGRTSVRGC